METNDIIDKYWVNDPISWHLSEEKSLFFSAQDSLLS